MNYNPKWISFYEELANSLLRYKDDRKPLIKKLEASKAMEGMPNLHEENGEFLRDICPFTIFSAFNRGRYTKLGDKIKIIERLESFLNVKPALLKSFEGIPTTRYGHFPLFSLEEGKMESDINTNWDMFEAAIKYTDTPTSEENKNKFLKLFLEVLDVRYMGMGNLSRSLFWIRPNNYVSLDKYSRGYIKEKFNIQQVDNIRSGEDYLDLIKKIKEEFENRTDVRSFAALSFVADGKTLINKDSKPDKEKTEKLRDLTSNNDSQASEDPTKFRRKEQDVERQRLHVKIQNKLIKDLKKKYGEDNVKKEKYRIDVLLIKDEKNFWIYEIKTDKSVSDCIREAVGQLLEYKFKAESVDWKRKVDKIITGKITVEKIIVVGPSKITPKDEEYIQYLKKTYKMEISYEQVEIKE